MNRSPLIPLLTTGLLALLPSAGFGQTGDEPLSDALVPPQMQRRVPAVQSPPAAPAVTPSQVEAMQTEYDRLSLLVKRRRAELKKLDARIKAAKEKAERLEKPVRVGEVIIVGNEKTRDDVIRREVPLYPGQVLSYPDLRTAERNLERLHIFEINPETGVRPTVTVIEPDSDAEVKNVLVQVQETNTGSLLFGVGVNGDAGLHGSIELNERNFDVTRIPCSYDDLLSGRAFRGAGQELRCELVINPDLSGPGRLFHMIDVLTGKALSKAARPHWLDALVSHCAQALVAKSCENVQSCGREVAQENAEKPIPPEIEKRLRELEKKVELVEIMQHELAALREKVQGPQPTPVPPSLVPFQQPIIEPFLPQESVPPVPSLLAPEETGPTEMDLTPFGTWIPKERPHPLYRLFPVPLGKAPCGILNWD